MSIADVVLFYSKFSPECKDCVNFVQQYKLPVALIALDTKEGRDLAFNGSLIQIKNVPSMIVSYEDGNVQLYVGKPKIMGWFVATTQQNQSRKQDIPEPTHSTTLRQKEKVNKRIKQKRVKSSKKMKNSKEDDGIELIFEEEEIQKPNNSSLKLSTKAPNVSPNANVMSMASKLMAERNRHLNIKDGDTP